MARILLAAALLTSMLVVVPAHAAGCQKVATGAPSLGGGNCNYVAKGPGVYSVATLSGFRVQYLRPGTTVWKTVAAQTAVPNAPTSGMIVMTGEIPTLAGDLVDVGIGIASMTVPACPPPAPPCGPVTLRWQDGVIAGRDISS